MAEIFQAQPMDLITPFQRQQQLNTQQAQQQQTAQNQQQQLLLSQQEQQRAIKNDKFTRTFGLFKSMESIKPESGKSLLSQIETDADLPKGTLDPDKIYGNKDKFIGDTFEILRLQKAGDTAGATKLVEDTMLEFGSDEVSKQMEANRKAMGISKVGAGNREETKIKFATDIAQSKLDTKLAKEGEPSREITKAEVGTEYEDIYGESVSESLLKAGGKSEITLQQKEFEDFQAQVGDSDREIRKNIRSISVIDAGLQQLQKGIISGAFAKAELGFKKALAKAGLVNPETQEKITNTESYAGFMGIRTGEVIRLFGAGTGLSDEDRKFADRISAGDITLDATSIDRLQKMNKQLLLEEAIIHNDLIDDFNLVRDDRGLKPSIRKKVDVGKFLPKGNGKQIDEDNAKIFFAMARGDARKAEELASEKGWKF